DFVDQPHGNVVHWPTEELHIVNDVGELREGETFARKPAQLPAVPACAEQIKDPDLIHYDPLTALRTMSATIRMASSSTAVPVGSTTPSPAICSVRASWFEASG